MDNLARDAMLANRSGVSYGKWKSQNPNTAPVQKEQVVPQGWKVCEHCGKPFKMQYGKRFCDINCRTLASRDRVLAQKREHSRMRSLAKKLEAEK